MMHCVLISTVPWRSRKTTRLLRQIADQSRLPEHIMLVCDGYLQEDLPVVPKQLKSRMIYEVNRELSGPGRRWEAMLETQFEHNDLITTVDDDLQVGPQHIERTEHACTKYLQKDGIVSWGGETPLRAVATVKPMNEPLELAYTRGGVTSMHPMFLYAYHYDEIMKMLLGIEGNDEIALSYWAWKHGRTMIRPDGAPDLIPETLRDTIDPRSQWLGRAARTDYLRWKVNQWTGWPPPPSLQERMKHPPRNVWLVSFPRSGNSMASSLILGCLPGGSFWTHWPLDRESFMDAWKAAGRTIEDSESARYVLCKAHQFRPEITPDDLVIILVRDGRDAMISSHHWGRDRLHKTMSYKVPPLQRTLMGHGWAGNWAKWHGVAFRKIQSHRRRLVFRYEDIKRHPRRFVRIVGEILGFNRDEIDRGIRDNFHDVFDFQTMKQAYPENFRRGTVGQWKDLSAEDYQVLLETIGNQLVNMGYCKHSEVK